MPTINYKLKDGTSIQGVTTIIGQNLGWNKQQLMWWANQEGLVGRNHKETAQKEADAGTIAHAMVEASLKKEGYVFPPEVDAEIIEKALTAFKNFQHWKETVRFQVISLEEHLVSEVHRFGATPDCVAIINRNASLFDWKTSNAVYADYLVQIAAYRVAWEEVHPDIPLVGGFYLYRMDKLSAAWTQHYWEELPEAWEAFKNVLRLNELHKLLKV